MNDDRKTRAAQRRLERLQWVREHGRLPDGIKHNASAYSNWGCRCETCTADNARSSAGRQHRRADRPNDDDGRIRIRRQPDGTYRTSDGRFYVEPFIVGQNEYSRGQKHFRLADLHNPNNPPVVRHRLYEITQYIDDQY